MLSGFPALSSMRRTSGSLSSTGFSLCISYLSFPMLPTVTSAKVPPSRDKLMSLTFSAMFFCLDVDWLSEAEFQFRTVWGYEWTDRYAASPSPPNLGFVFQREAARCLNRYAAAI